MGLQSLKSKFPALQQGKPRGGWRARGNQEPPEYTKWQNNTHRNWWQDAGLRKNVGCVCILYFGFYVAGYDTSYLNGLQANPLWLDYFGNPTGSRLGIINAVKYFPLLVIAPFIGMYADWIGRRICIMSGALFVVAGALVGALAINEAMLLVGRILAGIGDTLQSLGCILLIGEIAHPRIRGVATAGFTGMYYVGSTLSGFVTFATVAADWQSEWSWRLPTLIQAIGPIILLVGAIIMPESPRWLVKKGKVDAALKILADHHANGVQDDELVQNEMDEIKVALSRESEQNVAWMDFLRTPGNRRRLAVILTTGTGTQLNGVGIISYYLAPVLRLAGVTDPTQQTGLNAGLALWNLMWACLAASLVERLGRRPLWFASTIGMIIGYILLTALQAIFTSSGSQATGLAIVPIVFLTYMSYDWAWTPLAYAYTVEVLPFAVRARGMSIFLWTQQASIAFNQYINPIALEAIGWKYYLVYIFVLLFYLGLIYTLFIETAGYTMEEVATLFDAPGEATPVLASVENRGRSPSIESKAGAEHRETL